VDESSTSLRTLTVTAHRRYSGDSNQESRDLKLRTNMLWVSGFQKKPLPGCSVNCSSVSGFSDMFETDEQGKHIPLENMFMLMCDGSAQMGV
jgi:hypothetical protein